MTLPARSSSVPLSAQLPAPPLHALAISAALVERIAAEIRAHDGWISFARYMELALYTPGLGYYSGGATKLGSAVKDGSDFTTAPEMTPLFGRALARQIKQIMQLSAPHILEFGAGSGKLAAALLLELERLDALPESYAILDLSADLRARQKATLKEYAPHLLGRVTWLNQLPARIQGALIGNEVLDAMPVHLLVKAQDASPRGQRAPCGWLERGVALNAKTGLSFQDRPLDSNKDRALTAAIEAFIPASDSLPKGYVTEINRAAAAFITTLAKHLDQGAVVLIDYGFPEREYYHPQRSSGTLMMHYRHHAHDNPFLWPGLQDITAHVDFSAVQGAALLAGADTLGYTTQAHFLINCGIAHLLEGVPQNTAAAAAAWLRQTNALQKLISEAEMGELFKVIAFGKNIAEELVGFVQGDRCHTL
jgi:SAM-dependent MidA family methyltransferase